MFGDSAGGSLPAGQASEAARDIGGSSVERASRSCLLPVASALAVAGCLFGSGVPDLLAFFTVSLHLGSLFLRASCAVTCSVAGGGSCPCVPLKM